MTFFVLRCPKEIIITSIIQGQPTGTSHNVTIILPLIDTNPRGAAHHLKINVEPSYLTFLALYSVTFDNLIADTSYTFTLRIVLRAGTTVDVVAGTGLFMTLVIPSM